MARRATRLLVAALAAAVLTTAARGVQADERVDLGQARAQPCTRVGMATSVMAFFGLLTERRFYATRLLWLPRPRLPYAYLLFLNGGVVRTRRGGEVPAAVQRWLRSERSELEVIAINPRINRKEPKASALAVDWIRRSPDGLVVKGLAKGVWDCERRRIGRLVGGERAVESEESARAETTGHCRGNTLVRRWGHTATLCDLPRNARATLEPS